MNEKGKVDMRHVQSVDLDDGSTWGSWGLLLTTKDPRTGKTRVWHFLSATAEDRDMWVAKSDTVEATTRPQRSATPPRASGVQKP